MFGVETDRKSKRYERPFLLNNFDTKVYLPRLLNEQYWCKVNASGSNIYLTGQCKIRDSIPVKKYSSSTKSWKSLSSPQKV